MKDKYEVGYKKPPKDHQFKPKRLRDAVQGTPRQRKEKTLDLAGIFNKPLLVNQGIVRANSTNRSIPQGKPPFAT